MPDYQNGKIYKIEALNGEENDIYIGSTTKTTLAERMARHRSQYKAWKNEKASYTSSFKLFDKYGIENCRIYLIQNFPCNSKDELNAREGHYIKTIKCVNCNIAGQTRNEYRKKYNEVHQEHFKVYNKDYHDKHKDKKNETNKLNKFECECGSICRVSDKSKHLKTGLHKKYIENLENPIIV